MTDPKNTNTDPEAKPAGDEPVKTEGSGQGFDPSKLGDEDIKKILEDPRVWKTERLSKAIEAQKKLTEYEKQQAKREEEEMAKKQEFEKLSQKAQAERDEWKSKFENSVIDNALISEASKHNPQDIEAVLKLVDRSTVKYDDGKVVGADSAISQLQETKSYLFGTKTTQPVGNPSNPQDPTINEITLTQLQDPVFYNKHRDAIFKGKYKIVDDRA